MPIIGAPTIIWQCDEPTCHRTAQFHMTPADIFKSNHTQYYLSRLRVIIAKDGSYWYKTNEKIYCANHSAEV